MRILKMYSRNIAGILEKAIGCSNVWSASWSANLIVIITVSVWELLWGWRLEIFIKFNENVANEIAEIEQAKLDLAKALIVWECALNSSTAESLEFKDVI